MKKIYEEFFYVPKHGKVREKVMLTRIGTSIALILICMVAMSFSAYAYFTCNIASGVSTIHAARYELDVTAPEGISAESGGYALDNTAGVEPKEYRFTLVKQETTEENKMAKVGFAKIEVTTDYADGQGNPIVQPFYTEPIGTYLVNGQEMTVNTRTVTVTVPAGEKALVLFIAQWGSCGLQVIPDTNGVTAIDTELQYAANVDNGGENGSSDPAGPSTDAATDSSSGPSSGPSSGTQTQDSGTVTDSSTENASGTTAGTSTPTDTAQPSDSGTPAQSGDASAPETQTTDSSAEDTTDTGAPSDTAG